MKAAKNLMAGFTCASIIVGAYTIGTYIGLCVFHGPSKSLKLMKDAYEDLITCED